MKKKLTKIVKTKGTIILARFEVVSSTFSSRAGQICNAALDRSVIAYNENIPSKERERCR